ncbi:trihelix transcription factor ASIL2-like [Cucurbita maxima]|uniref:Trihelix transcription factor ASIL2-like n=1 Tax=Cucurbita maxima TaxID=3661 RepID=A0A6J1K0Q7_CUCMA|nr:trihelix transcription factor ASIL2-like [Cucurbita maxima]
MADLTDSLTPSSSISRQVPIREDCWTEDATSTLIDAWGRRFLDLNRGNLRQKDWLDVADSVNALHGLTKKTYRSDVQCKNRIDTVKKKYKTEAARVSSSHGSFVSSWPFYGRLHELIGPSAFPRSFRKMPPPAAAVVAVSRKRPAAAMDVGVFRKNYSAMAAAAAAAADALTEDEDEEEERVSEEEDEEEEEEEEAEGEGMSRLARAIQRFGEVYESVEAEKVRQMVELEKQRMQFAKDLEVQRMHMFMETQVQLEKIKRGKKKSTPSDM